MVNYQNRVTNKFNSRNTLMGGGVKRIFPSFLVGLNDNRYIVGSGVGSISSSNRSALKKRATNCLKCNDK